MDEVESAIKQAEAPKGWERQRFADEVQIKHMLAGKKCTRKCFENLTFNVISKLREPLVTRNRNERLQFIASITSVQRHAAHVHNEENPQWNNFHGDDIKYEKYHFCVACFQKVMGISPRVWQKALKLAVGKLQMVGANT